jgi:hypothetical protein
MEYSQFDHIIALFHTGLHFKQGILSASISIFEIFIKGSVGSTKIHYTFGMGMHRKT